jgi:hypothetical protein
VTGLEDQPVTFNPLTNDSDPEAQPLTITEVNGSPITPGTPVVINDPSGTPVGELVLNPNGTLTFTPNENFNTSTPPLPINYTIEDPSGATASATIRITIRPVNDAPVATDNGPVPTAPNAPVSGNVITDNTGDGVDSDVDGDTLTVTGFTVPGVPGNIPAGTPAVIPGVGTLVINPNGSYTFTPLPGYSGPVPSATYTISDGNGETDTGVLSFADVPVQQVEPPPQPAPAPAPPPPAPPAPPEDERRTTWGEVKTPPSAIVPPLTSKLGDVHVFYAVADSASNRPSALPLGATSVDAALAGEAAAQLPDSLLFANNSRGEHIGLIRERSFGEVQVVRPDLYVQHAVRHQPITTDPSLWVQHAVRSSQLESQLRSAYMEANNSAAPGNSTLVDPFALGAPKPEDSPIKVAEAAVPESRQETVAKAAPVLPAVKESVESAEKPVEKPRAAVGLRNQLQNFAKDRALGARPITRSTVSS